ncbi:TIGR01459 family HAD-type hydrolase [Fodinicurvata sp. EGI_FJ10296]|uniref:TIGR01459 family HAD-type hydrolase n=1 Tax=Fodinicurvata sp. EGI_FJ10296 TaxID=3231908 RepID=UPI003455FD6F
MASPHVSGSRAGGSPVASSGANAGADRTTPGRIGLPIFVDGMAALIDRHPYDAFIVDLWGVIHDGEQPLPGVIEGLTMLRDAGKVVCLLSNAPRRAETVAARMREIGIDDGLYTHLLTSGEATHTALSDRPDAFHQSLGHRVLHIGPPRDVDTVSAPGLVPVERAADASFVLVTGIDDPDETVADYADVLADAAAHGLPMVCANPDLVVVAGGFRAICAGALATHYESLGGKVAYHGKPHAPVYDLCRSMITRTLAGRGVAAPRILGVGDAFRTDILGAHNAGLDSMLVTGHGIHTGDLGIDADGRPDPVKLEAAIEEFGLRPTLVMPGFRPA